MTSTPHPDLVLLLERHGLTWAEFSRKGRLPRDLYWIAEKRRDVITELHLIGTPWAKMIEITGLSLGAIERGTRGAWNEASKRNRRESAARVGASRKGVQKPWLTEQLKQAWANGDYDFHRGRVRSQDEIERQKATYTPEVRARMSVRFKALWANPEYRDSLLAFHRSPEQRKVRSAHTSRQMAEAERCGKLTSIPAWYEPARCSNYPIFTKSSYERAACDLLDADPLVHDYDYEPRLETEHGFTFLPDFVVRFEDGRTTLIEVKAAWVLRSYGADHPKIVRLELARMEAVRRGWDFTILTEKDGLRDAIAARKDQERLFRRAS